MLVRPLEQPEHLVHREVIGDGQSLLRRRYVGCGIGFDAALSFQERKEGSDRGKLAGDGLFLVAGMQVTQVSPDHQEVDLINTVALSLRMSSRRKTVEYFCSQYNKAPDNPEIAFNYGICMSLFIAIAAEPREKLAAQLTAQNALSTCLEQRENWWLARFIRSEVLQSIPDGFFQMSQNIRSEEYKRMEPDHDISILIEQQKASG